MKNLDKVVKGALKSTWDAHGKIEVGSASKRIINGLRQPIAQHTYRAKAIAFKQGAIVGTLGATSAALLLHFFRTT